MLLSQNSAEQSHVRPALCKIAKQEIPRMKEIRKELLIHIPISLITTQIEREVKQLDERDMSWKLGREDAMRKWTSRIWRIAWDMIPQSGGVLFSFLLLSAEVDMGLS